MFADSLERLGLDAQATERDVKRAYARALKRIDMALDPQGFAQLRQDYETALGMVRNDFPHISYQFTIPEATETEVLATEDDAVEPLVEPPQYVAQPEPTTEPAPPSPQALAQQEFALFSNQISALPPSNQPRHFTALRQHLERETMVPLAVREAFESALVNALHQRYFGDNSGAMLLAAAEYYRWNLGDSKRLLDAGNAGWHLSRLLDDLSLLNEAQIQQHLLLTEPPQPKLAIHALEHSQKFSIQTPNAFAYVCPPEQMQRWQQARNRAPVLLRIKNYTYQRYQASTWIRGITKSAFFSLAIALVIVILGFFQSRETRILSTNCDHVYAQAMNQNWNGIYGEAIQVMRSCAREHPLLMCSDRDNLSKIASLQERLTPHDAFLYLDSAVQFNMADGRGFALSPVADCTSRIRVLKDSHWRQFGDIEAARQAISNVANCPIDEKNSGDSNFLSLLKHTDAWPQNTVKSPSQATTISLTDLMLPAVPIDPREVIPPSIAWARCETDEEKALSLTTTQAGPKERTAINGRAAKRFLKLMNPNFL